MFTLLSIRTSLRDHSPQCEVNRFVRSFARPGLGACAALAFLAMSALSVRAADPWYDDRVQLKLAPGIDIEDINADYGTTIDDSLPPLYLLAVPDSVPPQQILLQMSTDSRIEWAEPGYLDETPETTRQMFAIIVGGTVTDYQDQAVLERIRLDAILAHTTGSGMTVAVLDTGVESGHPALAGSVMKGGYDFVDEDLYPEDTANGLDDDDDGEIDEGAGHGTMVAGIVHLVAPDAEILPVRILDDEGRGTSFAVAKALVFAADAGAHVINMSFGLPIHCYTIAWGVEYAADAGVILVGAAGNDGTEFPPYYPASDPEVLSVAALDSTDVKSSFSNFHSTVAVSAPGNGILAPFRGGEYAIGAGTSFAAPFISGQAALVRAGAMSPMMPEVVSVIRNGVVEIDQIPGNIPFVGKLGSGRFDGLETWLAMSPAADAPVASLGSPHWSVFPNPSSVSQTVMIRARGEGPAARSATVHDLAGRLVARLTQRGDLLGWDGRDSDGRLVPSGRYLVQIETASGTEAVSILRTR